MDINIPGLAEPVLGTNPLIILGANGSGKTRLAVEMAKTPGIEFIAALRNIAMPDQIPNWTLATATNELTTRTTQRRNSHWELILDIDALFGKLLSSHGVEAMRVYDEVREGKTPSILHDTVLDKTKQLWRIVFPGRNIVFSDFSARVTNDYLGGGASYSAKQMSDGERTGLYLAAKILDSVNHVVIIDEPETHFHSRLAVRFWDALETMCSEKRFVYVTHDLNFALSRNQASIILARPNQPPEMIRPGGDLATEDIASILGAASFSVYAKRLVFCEGREEKSLDQELLRAWFKERDTALIPVGGCENVKRCTSAFQTSNVVSGFKAIGIIDRDHWPEDILAGQTNVHVLAVHEVESLYILPSVYIAVGTHLGMSRTECEARYLSLFDGFRNQMSGTLANRLVYERFKACSTMLAERAFISPVDFKDAAKLRNNSIYQMRGTRPFTDPDNLWDEEAKVVSLALQSADPLIFLKMLPGKPLLGPTATSLKISKETYCDLVKTALTSSEKPFEEFSKSIETALTGYLPARTIVEA